MDDNTLNFLNHWMPYLLIAALIAAGCACTYVGSEAGAVTAFGLAGVLYLGVKGTTNETLKTKVTANNDLLTEIKTALSGKAFCGAYPAKTCPDQQTTQPIITQLEAKI